TLRYIPLYLERGQKMENEKEIMTKMPFQQIEHFIEAHEDNNPGRQLNKIREIVPSFKDWHANRSWKAPVSIVLTTLWISEMDGGPYKYVSKLPNNDSLDLKSSHYDMKLTEAEVISGTIK